MRSNILRRFKRMLAVMMVCVTALCLAGCKPSEDDGKKEGDRSELTTSFLDDTVFTVSDERVSLTEWYLYALWQISGLESMYGKTIWDYSVDGEGTTMWDAVKEDIMEQIVYIKIVCARAESLGITLNEDDQLDINLQTEDFMNKLTTEQKSKYKITPEIVKGIYEDNVLAMKVYENLTLNIDTNIPDEEVRHMILEYVPILKDYESEDGEIVRYTDAELLGVKAEAEQYLADALADPEITRLAEINNDKYNVVEIIADYATLVEKLPENIPGIAFSLRQDEINGLYETEDAYFILDCVKHTDEETTNAARIRIIEARQKALFEEQYSVWEKETVIKTNYKVWDELGRE